MSVRDIQGHLEEMYGVEVSLSLISDVTDGVMEQARAWQNRPLDTFYAVVAPGCLATAPYLAFDFQTPPMAASSRRELVVMAGVSSSSPLSSGSFK